MKKNTHYDSLGVSRNAPTEVIRAAYKAMAQKNHPDKNIGNPAADELMKTINHAHDVLSDADKRAAYDASLIQQDAEEQQQAAQSQPQSPYYSHAQSPPQPRAPQSNNSFMFLLVMAGLAGFFIVFAFRHVPKLPSGQAIQMPTAAKAKPATAESTVKAATPQELATCIFADAQRYHVPPSIILSILSVEGGAPGKITATVDGSYDFGMMQINSAWIPQLEQLWHVPAPEALHILRDDSCLNIGVGVWILQSVITKTDDLQKVIGLYRVSAHHMNQYADSQDYINNVIKMMEVYKNIHTPADLFTQSAK